MVEWHFLPCANHFLLFNLFFLQVETVTEISGNPFFEEKTLFPLAKRDFLSSQNCLLILLFRASFLQAETVTETN